MQPADPRPVRAGHALVTGGGRGMGVAIAAALARRGCSISLLGRTAATLGQTAQRLADEHGVPVHHALADIADEAAVAAAVASCRERLGPVSVLVNNAGIAPSAPFLASDTALWRRVLDVDLMGAVHATRAVLPDMLEAGRGRIVNIASTAALTGMAYVSAYCAAKHALLGFTRALAIEMVRKGITDRKSVV